MSIASDMHMYVDLWPAEYTIAEEIKNTNFT